jgi:hypothetical protein
MAQGVMVVKACRLPPLRGKSTDAWQGARQRRAAGREAEDANLRDEQGQKARQNTPGRDQYKHNTTQHN